MCACIFVNYRRHRHRRHRRRRRHRFSGDIGCSAWIQCAHHHDPGHPSFAGNIPGAINSSFKVFPCEVRWSWLVIPGLRKTSGKTFTTSFSSESHKLCTCEQVRSLTSIASDRKTLKRWVERTIFQSPGQRSIVKYTLNCAIKIP